MQVSHRTVGNNYSASSHLLSQNDGNTGWKGHLEVFSLTCLKWDCLQHVIASAMALSGQVLKTTRDGAVYHAGSAFVFFCLRVYLVNHLIVSVMHLGLNYLILQV